MLLEITKLNVHYGSAQALWEVSLMVEDKKIVVLLGANGAGKTTILRAISSLKHPTSGEIWFLDKRIDRRQPEEIVRLGIAHCPEGKMLFSSMSVLENLKMGAYLQKQDNVVQQNLDGIFKIFPVLEERQRQSAGTLSGGEQQMLAIGRALMSKPKLLLLDEPTLGLSPLLVQKVAQVIRDIHQLGLGILLVEQNSALGLRLAEYGYILETGEVVLEGKTQDLQNNERVKKAYLGM